MNYKLKLFGIATLYPTIYLGLFYLLWIFRMHDQGRSVTGIIATILVGCIFLYIAQALDNIKKKEKLMATLDLAMAGLFVHFSYIALLELNTSMVTGKACKLAGHNTLGWFGIEGFWGLGIVVPIYFCISLILWLSLVLWEHYDPWWNIKWWWRRRKLANKLRRLGNGYPTKH